MDDSDDQHDEAAGAAPPAPTSRRAKGLVMAVQASTLLVALTATALFGWLWLSPERLAARLLPALDLDGVTADLGAGTRAAGALLTLPALALLLYALWQVNRFFACFRTGRILSATAARAIRHIALGVGALALLRPLMRAVYAWLLTDGGVWALPRIGVGDLLALLFSAVFFAIGLAFAEAARLRDDYDHIL